MENLSRYQKAALVWLEQNPDRTLRDCSQKEKVVLETGEEITLGQYLSRIKIIYRAMQKGKKYGSYSNLPEEEIAWWTERGLSWKISRRENNIEKYHEAALVWLEQNPGKTLRDCPQREKLILETGKVVALGSYLHRIRMIYRAMQKGEKYGTYQDLTKTEIDWWSEHGISWEIFQRNNDIKKYQKAALVWLEQNPDKTLGNCPQKEKVMLETGEEIVLGQYLNRIKMVYRAMQKGKKYGSYSNLTEEEIEWWTAHGLSWKVSKNRYEKKTYQKAALVWLEQHPTLTLVDCPSNTKVILKTGEEVVLGSYLSRIKTIYRAMQKGEKYGRYLDLTDEEITWWSSHGLFLESFKVQSDDIAKMTVLENVKKHLESVVLEDWLVEIFTIIVKRYNNGKIYNEEKFLQTTESVLIEYMLNSFEKKLLYEHLRDYFSRIKEIDIIRLGLETDENKKIVKIQKYGLDEFDIEESFFVFLKSEKDELLRKKYELLRSYIIDWNYYSIEEKEEIEKQNGFGVEDIKYIEDTRKQIDELVQKVKELRK